MLALVVFYLVTASFRITKKEFYATATMAVMGGCLAAVYAAIDFYHGGGFQTNQGNRASLVVANNALDPNYFAASLLLPLSLTVAGLLSTRSWTKRLAFWESSSRSLWPCCCPCRAAPSWVSWS